MIFFFNDTATTEIYTLSLHDALPIFRGVGRVLGRPGGAGGPGHGRADGEDRKSTRLNSSHLVISYAVFCLKKNKKPSELHEGCRSIRSLSEREKRSRYSSVCACLVGW